MLEIRDSERHIGIVMAKGISERVHKKNLQVVGGKPLFVHALDTLRHSGACGTIIVSTTTDELANMALDWGADDIIIRDPKLIDWYPSKAFTLKEYERKTGIAYHYCSVLGETRLLCCLRGFASRRIYSRTTRKTIAISSGF